MKKYGKNFYSKCQDLQQELKTIHSCYIRMSNNPNKKELVLFAQNIIDRFNLSVEIVNDLYLQCIDDEDVYNFCYPSIIYICDLLSSNGIE